MNYYERHIGDYLKDTVGLSMLEDGAYNRLIDQGYVIEGPLPKDNVYRLARANTPAEKRAVDFVLGTFFVLTPEGYRQKRIDVEVARFQGKQRKARASAEVRWNKSDGNAIADANASKPDMRTHSEGNATRARPQSPVTSNQKEIPPASRVPPADAGKRPTKKCPATFEVTPELRAWADQHAPGVDVDRETETLRDHTFATARVDWVGTWRNWMRKATPKRGAAFSTPKERDAANARDLVRKQTGGLLERAFPDDENTIDMEETHAPRLENH